MKRVYVGSLGNKEGTTDLREKLIRRLRGARGIQVVESPSQADAILTGSGAIWLQGYISTNPKPSPYNRQPVYGGYLSVQLHGKDSATLWSADIKPGVFPWSGVAQDLVNRAAKQLLLELHQNRRSK
ncbi:MAG TPA: LptE family protein [Candidatus Sulfotelmatobacter sp.]|nr:LptE family protein [Candidatus Sulfotelmatobacter sp.]